jgi:hypothetical protein
VLHLINVCSFYPLLLQLPIYSADAIDTYHLHSGASVLPPHIYLSTAAALQRIATGTRAQSIIIRSGSMAAAVFPATINPQYSIFAANLLTPPPSSQW